MSALYPGRVMHLRRMGAGKHQFRYRVFRLWLDVDRIAETLGTLRTVGHNRINLFGFRERDHGPRDGSPLRPWVEKLLAAEGVAAPARIMLLCFPRVLGYEFNPLALYTAYDVEGTLTGIVYQVRNTDGDLSPYAVNVAREGLTHRRRKDFYVSPFIDNNQRYAFSLVPPGDDFAVRIRVDGPDGLTLIATENAERQPLTDPALLRLALTLPLMTFKVIAAIYFEAVRLRFKGALFFRHPGNRGRYCPATQTGSSELQDAQ